MVTPTKNCLKNVMLLLTDFTTITEQEKVDFIYSEVD